MMRHPAQAPQTQETSLLFSLPTRGISPFLFSALRELEFTLGSNFLNIFYLEKID